jgi:DNA-binding NtrC family response regulator
MPRNEGNSNKVILVCEDDEQVRELVSAVLAKAGYMVVTAKDTALALSISRQYQGKIDVLLTDVELGDADGITLAREITAQRPETGVLLTSGNSDYKSRTEFLLLPKPFTPQNLLNGVAAAIKRVETGRKHRRSRSNGI